MNRYELTQGEQLEKLFTDAFLVIYFITEK